MITKMRQMRSHERVRIVTGDSSGADVNEGVSYVDEQFFSREESVQERKGQEVMMDVMRREQE